MKTAYNMNNEHDKNNTVIVNIDSNSNINEGFVRIVGVFITLCDIENTPDFYIDYSYKIIVRFNGGDKIEIDESESELKVDCLKALLYYLEYTGKEICSVEKEYINNDTNSVVDTIKVSRSSLIGVNEPIIQIEYSNNYSSYATEVNSKLNLMRNSIRSGIDVIHYYSVDSPSRLYKKEIIGVLNKLTIIRSGNTIGKANIIKCSLKNDLPSNDGIIVIIGTKDVMIVDLYGDNQHLVNIISSNILNIYKERCISLSEMIIEKL